MDSRKLLAIAGFVILGLSPSFVDWQEQPEQRPKMVAFYTIGVVLIYAGVLRRS